MTPSSQNIIDFHENSSNERGRQLGEEIRSSFEENKKKTASVNDTVTAGYPSDTT